MVLFVFICIQFLSVSWWWRHCTPIGVIKTISHELLELLEKLQTSRLDDQRCVLPAYFTTQVNFIFFSFFPGIFFYFFFWPPPLFIILNVDANVASTTEASTIFPRSCLCSCFLIFLLFILIFFFSLGNGNCKLYERKYAQCPSRHVDFFFLALLNLVWCVYAVCVCVCVFVIGYVFHFPYCRARRFVSGPHLFHRALCHIFLSFPTVG